ncbi:MAG: type IV pilus twitching motility protein PilT [Actinomycetota bacterium]|nr:type IV pilus twitching motility protein PilT [Actinomycetota bacterium]
MSQEDLAGPAGRPAGEQARAGAALASPYTPSQAPQRPDDPRTMEQAGEPQMVKEAAIPARSVVDDFEERGAARPDGQQPWDPGLAIAELLETVLDREASDLHLLAGTPPLIRVNGDLEALTSYGVLGPNDVKQLIHAILTESQRERLVEDLELDCAYSLRGRGRFRVNVYYQRGSMSAAFRLIPYGIKTVEELGLPPVVSELARLRRGLVIVTGPTGSGKSTTLAAMVDIVNQERLAHVLTVEDPIEFLHRHKNSAVSQREVGYDTHGFAPALKHALRQDPDVIMVGEMRDLETIATAISAAETGHLVFATLHTQDAAQTVDRIIDVFPAYQQQQIRVQLSITLQGVMAQQLVPTADGAGRVVACEVLVVTPAIRNLIREGKTHQIYSAIQSGRKFSMHTMDSCLADRVVEGVITEAAGLLAAHDPDMFTRLLGSAARPAAMGSQAGGGYGGGTYQPPGHPGGGQGLQGSDEASPAGGQSQDS